MIRWLALAVVLLTVAVPGVWSAETPTTDVCFTPGEDCTGLIVRLLNEAKQEILVHAYSFTSAPIAEALVQAHRRGVAVTVILDRSQGRDQYSQADFLAHTGVPTFIDRRHAAAHNKIVLIDRHTVVTGSFNYTRAAQEKNAENLLVLQGDQKLLQRYREYFELHKRHAEAAVGVDDGDRTRRDSEARPSRGR